MLTLVIFALHNRVFIAKKICFRLRMSCVGKIKVCYYNGTAGRDGRVSLEVGRYIS